MRILIDGSSLRGARTGCFTYLHNLLANLAVEDPHNEYFLLDFAQLFQVQPLPDLPRYKHLELFNPAHRLQSPSRSLVAKAYNRLVPPVAKWLWTPALGQSARSLLRRVDVYSIQEYGLFANPEGATVITIHDITTRTHPHLHLASNRRSHERKIRFAERHADIVITDAHSTVRDLATHTDIEPGRVRVIYPGTDPEARPIPPGPERDRLLARFGLGNAPYLLGVGTLEPRKNWPAALEVFRRLRRTRRNLKLVIAGGKGWLASNLLDQIAAHPDRQAIVLTGYVTSEEKWALYSGCAVFLFPSFYEGFGLPVLEAMRCGAPVVCSNASSLAEVGGEGALQTEPDNHEQLSAYCEAILGDEAYRQQRVEAGLSWSGRFCWSQCARQMVGLFQEVSKRL